MDSNGSSDPYVKTHLLPGASKVISAVQLATLIIIQYKNTIQLSKCCARIIFFKATAGLLVGFTRSKKIADRVAVSVQANQE